MADKKTKTIDWAKVKAAFLKNPCLYELLGQFGVPDADLREKAQKDKWYEELQKSCKDDVKVIRLNFDRSERRLEGFPVGLYPYGIEPLTRWALTKVTVGTGVQSLLAEVVVRPEKGATEARKRLAEAEQAEKDKLLKHIVTQKDLDGNPSLGAQGVKVGDEIEIPIDETEATK